MRLAGAVIRILTEYHNSHFGQGCVSEGAEYLIRCGIDLLSGRALVLQKVSQTDHVVIIELSGQMCLPGRFKLYGLFRHLRLRDRFTTPC